MAKTTRTKTAPDREALEAAAVASAMKLSGEIGWRHVTLAHVAEDAGMSLGTLRGLVRDKTDLLSLFIRRLDAEVLAEDGGYTDEDSIRDRLFDLLMRRFDALTPYREGVESAFRSVTGDPLAALTMAPVGVRALGWYLDAAGVGTDGPIGILRLKGLAAVWLSALRVWFRDDTDDLAKTMKALDKALARAERAALTLEGRRPFDKETTPGETAEEQST